MSSMGMAPHTRTGGAVKLYLVPARNVRAGDIFYTEDSRPTTVILNSEAATVGARFILWGYNEGQHVTLRDGFIVPVLR